jgi:uncharacterized protein with HEPN domain
VKDDRVYLDNVRERIDRIQTYTSEGQDIFLQTPIIQDAVIRNLEIIGEAIKQLSQKTKQAYPEVPWKQIAGLRDVLIHDYLKVDLDRVWIVIERDLPSLRDQVDAILQELGGEM